MRRLVLDTNILIAALLRKNTAPYRLYEAWRNKVYELITSQAQLDELKRVMGYAKLERYFSREEAQEMFTGIATYATCTTHLPLVHYSSDPDDNLILATAIAGKAHYVVSGDKSDMLALTQGEAIPIITACRAIDVLNSEADSIKSHENI